MCFSARPLTFPHWRKFHFTHKHPISHWVMIHFPHPRSPSWGLYQKLLFHFSLELQGDNDVRLIQLNLGVVEVIFRYLNVSLIFCGTTILSRWLERAQTYNWCSYWYNYRELATGTALRAFTALAAQDTGWPIACPVAPLSQSDLRVGLSAVIHRNGVRESNGKNKSFKSRIKTLRRWFYPQAVQNQYDSYLRLRRLIKVAMWRATAKHSGEHWPEPTYPLKSKNWAHRR